MKVFFTGSRWTFIGRIYPMPRESSQLRDHDEHGSVFTKGNQLGTGHNSFEAFGEMEEDLKVLGMLPDALRVC